MWELCCESISTGWVTEWTVYTGIYRVNCPSCVWVISHIMFQFLKIPPYKCLNNIMEGITFCWVTVSSDPTLHTEGNRVNMEGGHWTCVTLCSHSNIKRVLSYIHVQMTINPTTYNKVVFMTDAQIQVRIFLPCFPLWHNLVMVPWDTTAGLGGGKWTHYETEGLQGEPLHCTAHISLFIG